MTAETAVAIPLLLALTLAMVWLLALAAAQVRVIDAAREAARAVARGDPTAQAVSLGQRVAGSGSTVDITADGEWVRARVSLRVGAPRDIGVRLPSALLHAEAVALMEQTAMSPVALPAGRFGFRSRSP